MASKNKDQTPPTKPPKSSKDSSTSAQPPKSEPEQRSYSPQEEVGLAMADFIDAATDLLRTANEMLKQELDDNDNNEGSHG